MRNLKLLTSPSLRIHHMRKVNHKTPSPRLIVLIPYVKYFVNCSQELRPHNGGKVVEDRRGVNQDHLALFRSN